jgi:hypothetical protein
MCSLLQLPTLYILEQYYFVWCDTVQLTKHSQEHATSIFNVEN